jgi:hypothetical protein
MIAEMEPGMVYYVVVSKKSGMPSVWPRPDTDDEARTRAFASFIEDEVVKRCGRTEEAEQVQEEIIKKLYRLE